MYAYWPIRLDVDDSLPADIIQMSKTLLGQLNLEPGCRLPLYLGRNFINVNISMQAERRLNRILVSTCLCRQLYMQPGREYGIRCDEEGLHIGPVVGIMADSIQDRERPFASQSNFFRHCLTEGAKLGMLCFAFPAAALQFQKGCIKGYCYQKGKWEKGIYPIPDVVYPREAGYSPYKKRIWKRLLSLGCRFINPPYLDKWQSYQSLSKDHALQPYLPATRLVRDFQQIDSMLKRCRVVYVKPVAGAKGRSIIRITKRRRSFVYQYQLNGRMIQGKSASLKELQGSLRRIMGNRKYIVQERIHLIKSKEGIIDVRILVQKDGGGRWQVTGKACRIGQSGAITSNLSSGGKGQPLGRVIQAHFNGEQSKRIMAEINDLALLVARTIELEHGLMGEMGIDVGVDQAGKLWFIEINLRPARRLFTLIGEHNTRLLSIQRPMLYSQYLAGFRQRKELSG